MMRSKMILSYCPWDNGLWNVYDTCHIEQKVAQRIQLEEVTKGKMYDSMRQYLDNVSEIIYIPPTQYIKKSHVYV